MKRGYNNPIQSTEYNCLVSLVSPHGQAVGDNLRKKGGGDRSAILGIFPRGWMGKNYPTETTSRSPNRDNGVNGPAAWFFTLSILLLPLMLFLLFCLEVEIKLLPQSAMMSRIEGNVNSYSSILAGSKNLLLLRREQPQCHRSSDSAPHGGLTQA